MQRLIWADVRNNYYRRLGDTRLTGLHAPGPAFYARYLQAAVRRLLTFVRNHRNINFSMLAASNATRGSLVWKHRFDNLHERRIRYRVATSPKWYWGMVGQYHSPGDPYQGKYSEIAAPAPKPNVPWHLPDEVALSNSP